MDEADKELFGDFELVKLIGDGAQGRVYQARCVSDASPHVRKDELVAIKIVHISGEDEKLRTKFMHQADILRRLKHENIVLYRDCFTWHSGEWDEAQCLVLELLEGVTLHERLKTNKTGLPWPEVDSLFRQCLAGLMYAREQGITHRDIKPSNIFITRDGKAKLIDFDIARREDSDQKSSAGWKGTFDYMSPDFVTLEGFHGDEQSDLFSLGVCFYQALTGCLPFDAFGDAAQIGYISRWRNVKEPAPSFRPGVFRVLSNAKAVVLKSLAPKREARYATFAALYEDLQKIHYRRVSHKNKDDYELTEVLGRGGFGEVFKARRVSDGMVVAVKYLFSEKQSDRFIKEAKILQQYPHPNLVKYVDFMVLDGVGGEKQFFLVMEYLEGMPGWTLRPRLKSEGRLAIPEVVPLFRSYLKALQFLHENPRPIIHRDIKPGNLYAPVGHPEMGKIFDLGVARDVTGTVTVGGVPGTLDYMAPEFCDSSGDRGSPQSDLYALGLCLYEAVVGKTAYERFPTEFNAAWIAFQNRLRNPPAVSFADEVFTQYPKLKDVILKSIAQNPAARYRSAAEMCAALEAVMPSAMRKPAPADNEETGPQTLATLSGGLRPSPGTGATPDAYPLAGAGGQASEPVDQLVAGEGAERRRSRRTRQVAVGAAAALLALGLVGGGVWYSLQPSGGGSQAGRAGAAQMPVEQVRPSPEAPKPVEPKADKPKPSEPSAVPQPVPLAKKEPPPVPPKETPKVAPKEPPKEPAKPALATPETDPVYIELKNSIPQAIARDADWAAADWAAGKLAAQEKAPWPGIDDVEKGKRIAALRDVLTKQATLHIARVRDAALAAYTIGQDGKKDRERLLQMAAGAPSLKPLVAAPLDEAVRHVDAAYAEVSVAATLAGLPDRIAQAADEQAVQSLMAAFGKLEATPNIKLRPEQVRAVEQAFGDKFLAVAGSHAKRAQEEYAAGRLAEGAVSQKRVTELAAAVTPRFGREALDKLAGDVEARRKAAADKAAQLAAARKKQLAEEAARRLDELGARVQKGSLAACTNSLSLLASLAPEASAEADYKAKWEAVRSGFAKLVAATLALKDPLSERAQRVKAVEDVLGHASAGTLLAAERAALAQTLNQQKAVCVLRLINQGGNAVQVSGKEIRDKVTLKGGEVKEWDVPVPGETLTVSISVDGGNRYRSRIETVRLVRAGGVERTLGALEAEAAKPVEPAVASAPATGAGAAKPAVFEITVSPKTAAVTVDGEPVESGRAEVTPNENHKVTVESAGYKTVQQYYRARPGETRKIDILLEKAPKKSLFGF